MTSRFLLAVDDSEASDAAVDYLSARVRSTDARVRVVHALPRARTSVEDAAEGPPPPSSAVERWLALSRAEARPLLERAVRRLVDGGVADAAVESGFVEVHLDESAVDGLLAEAREHRCETLVVGRSSLPWHRELFHHHVADELVRRARGFAVWVVG